jgi:putative hemolysin
MSGIGFQITAILLLVLANGLFALSEIAVVSSRRARLQRRVEEGSKSASIALELSHHPDTFLSTVQIGITLIGILAGAFGGATLAQALAPHLNRIPYVAPHGDTFAFGFVVVAISYLSLILGELVPKRLGLSNPERFASALAPFMLGISKIAAPAVSFLSWSTNLVMRILPFREGIRPEVTEDEVRLMMRQGAASGTFHASEHQMVEGVFRLGDRRAVELMQPRHVIIWIDLEKGVDEMYRVITEHKFSRFPVGDGTLDRLIGMVHVKDLVNRTLSGDTPDIRSLVRPMPVVPESMPALKALEVFRESGTHIAAVVNEHGGVEGILTLIDIMESIVGELSQDGGPEQEWATKRDDGSWLVDGMMPVYEFTELVGVKSLPRMDEGVFTTLGGFVMTTLERIPKTGDRFDSGAFSYEVMDMDGNRVDKVLVTPNPTPPASE